MHSFHTNITPMDINRSIVRTIFLRLIQIALVIFISTFLFGCSDSVSEQPVPTWQTPNVEEGTLNTQPSRGTVVVSIVTSTVDGVSYRPEKWLASGWTISDQPVIDPILDCSLHPRDKVPDQFTGMCYTDQVVIPKDGAPYITAIMDDDGDGQEMSVEQIAP